MMFALSCSCTAKRISIWLIVQKTCLRLQVVVFAESCTLRVVCFLPFCSIPCPPFFTFSDLIFSSHLHPQKKHTGVMSPSH